MAAKLGELKVRWGRECRSSPSDLLYEWGEGADKSDARLLCSALNNKNLEMRFPVDTDAKAIATTQDGYSIIENQSLLEELESRGYDLKTLRISIKRKA